MKEKERSEKKEIWKKGMKRKNKRMKDLLKYIKI